ncbi:MAG: sel1 repeat family protein, partial [Elusimicrobiales bacterium]|nr:sel1 repeat family protein [Elusimicrobiales bacterium]
SFLQKAADKGNEIAQLAIAVKYHTGDWNSYSAIQKNDAEAVRRLNDLSKSGNKYAKDYLAKMYMTGDGLPADYYKAYTLFKDIVKDFHDYNYLYDIMSIYQMAQGNDDLGKETLSFTENALKNLKDDKENKINISKEILGTVLGMIGSIYENGLGVPQDYAKALEYYEESQKTGNIFAKGRIGVMTAMGMGKEADKEEAARMMSDLVNTADMMVGELGSKGDSMRLLMSGKLYYDKAEKAGKSFISDIPGLKYFDSKNRYYRKAAKYFNKALKEKHRDPISSFYLGFMSLKGKGVKKDFTKALDYFGRYGKIAIGFLFISSFQEFERAKEEISDPECDGACIMAKLSAENSFAIGFISFFSGMPDNPLLASSSSLDYIKKAAENGDENAKEFISKMENGLDTPKAWLEKLAEQGSSHAQLMLGDISAEKKETDLAKSWYMKSAEQNNAEALFKLGELYMFGEIDGKPDYKQAMEYMSKSAEQGRFEYLFSLAFMHGYGLGTSVNTKKYNEYVNKAWEEFPLYDMREKAKDKVSAAYIFAKSVYNISTLRVTMGSSDIKEGQGKKAADDYSGDKYFYGITKMQEDYHKANVFALSTMHWLA